MITLTKNKYLYCAKGDDAFVLSAITGIKITNGACMFSQEHLRLVLDAIESFYLSYCIEEGTLTIHEEGSDKEYNYLLDIGKTSNKVQRKIKEENARIRKKLKHINQL